MIPRLVLAGLLALVWTLAAGAAPSSGPETFPTTLLASFRSGLGLSLPTRDAALDRLCAARAAELAAAGSLSHQDAKGRGPGLQSLAGGYLPGEYGEVLGAGVSEAAVWEAWLASQAHRAVLAAPGWTRWGAASARAGAGLVWVVRFWRP